MYKKIALAVALVLVVSVSCFAAATPLTKTVSLDQKVLKKSSPPPKTAGKDVIAAEVDITYPLLSSLGKDVAVDAVNKAIQSRLLGLLEGQAPTTPEQLVEAFFRDYEKSVKEQPDMPGGWSMKFEATVRHADADLICLEVLQSMFLGGAHPDSNISYLVFSMKTGEPIDLSGFVPEKNLGDLTKVAEKHFREVRKLKPEETYEQAGFQFEGNSFALNKNFLASKDGLAFCFNAYEIGPYAMGLTELVIPWNELKTVIDPKGPAAGFLNPKN